MSGAIEVDDEVLRRFPLPALDGGADKRGRGTVLVVGGSRETPGSVLLAGVAALRVGAGRLRIATASTVAREIAVAVPEARVLGLGETPTGGLRAGGGLASLVTRADAVLVGTGVLDDDAADDVVDTVLGSSGGPVIVDAGGLPATARHPDWLDRVAGRVVLVPNVDEAGGLGGAWQRGAVVSVRGATTETRGPDGPVYVDDRGSVGLATSGSGDVAAGIVAGLAARGADPLTAALHGARLHRLAGECLGPPGFLARELLAVLPSLL